VKRGAPNSGAGKGSFFDEEASLVCVWEGVVESQKNPARGEPPKKRKKRLHVLLQREKAGIFEDVLTAPRLGDTVFRKLILGKIRGRLLLSHKTISLLKNGHPQDPKTRLSKRLPSFGKGRVIRKEYEKRSTARSYGRTTLRLRGDGSTPEKETRRRRPDH